MRNFVNASQVRFSMDSGETITDEAATSAQSSTDKQAAPDKPEPPPKIAFHCELCSFRADCDYKGTKPPFARNIEFLEPCYVMQDPFSPPPGHLSSKSNSEYFIVIGADCGGCGRSVCASANCSIFYRKHYCGHCAHRALSEFPLEIQSKIRKTFAQTQIS